MSTNDPESSGRPGTNPDELSRLLEIELIQKRAAWQRASDRHRSIRSAAFFFLFVIAIAALVALYFAFMRASETRQHRAPGTPTESATP